MRKLMSVLPLAVASMLIMAGSCDRSNKESGESTSGSKEETGSQANPTSDDSAMPPVSDEVGSQPSEPPAEAPAPSAEEDYQPE